MRKQVLGFVVCAGVLLTGCMHVRPARVCAEWRWIGIKSSSTDSCRAAPGWTAEQLFGDPAERRGILVNQERIPEYTRRQTAEPQQSRITPAELAAAQKLGHRILRSLDTADVDDLEKPRPVAAEFESLASRHFGGVCIDGSRVD